MPVVIGGPREWSSPRKVIVVGGKRADLLVLASIGPTALSANGVFSNAVPLGPQLKAPQLFRASSAALKARARLRCFETLTQSTLVFAVL